MTWMREQRPATPLLSVIVPTYQRRARVVGLLNSLCAQDAAAADFEVVLAVDGSSDGTRQAVEAMALPFALRVAEQPNRGRSAARNLGVRTSCGPLLLFLDDDMEPTPALVRTHIEAHRADGRAIALGPMPIAGASGPLRRYRAAVFTARFEPLRAAGTVPGVMDACMGNLSVSKSLFDEAGGFDEEFSGYGLEDFELVQRLVNAGGRLCYSPDAIALQHYDKTLAELARDVEDEGRNAVLLASKHPALLPSLKLGRWRNRSLRHRAVLTRLLRWTLRLPLLRTAMIGVARVTLPAPGRGSRRALDHTFDYLYWLGVCRAPGGPGEALLRGASMEHALAEAGLLPNARHATGLR
jgi:GT2 family glycosyltransferase